MIQIYKQSNNDFKSNGDMVLLPYTCYLDTSTWELNLNHPIDEDGRWSYIVEDAVLKVPSFNGNQLFRISHKTKMDSGVEAIAKPIFFDSKDDCMLMDVRPTDKNGQQALDIMMNGTKYSGQSNITKISTAYYVIKNLMESISSDDENSFLNRWGGEVLYDNYKVIINEKLGSDRGVVLLYGKNIPVDGLSEEIAMEDVTTRIIPKAYNGYMLDGSSPWVDSPLINKYPKVRARTIEYSDIKLREDAQENDAENGVIVCDSLAILRDELRKKCNKEFQDGIDKPKVTITINMVMLHKSIEYEDYKILEDITKGDVVHCKHDKLGVVTDARVVDLTYDCVLDCIDSVVIGDVAYSYINDTSSIIHSVSQVVDSSKGTVMAEKVAGIINGINAQLKIQRSISKKLEARALFMEDTDPNSPLYGATSWGTSGIEFTKRRTADGKDWDWSTAFNANGLIANAIVTGLLSDRAGNNYWNLDTGTFNTKFAKIMQATITDAVITGTLQGATINGGNISGTNIVGGTIKGNTTIDVGTYLKVGNGIILDESADDYSSRSITLGRTFMSYTGKKTSGTSNFVLSTNTNGGYSNLTANGGLNPSSGLSTYKGNQGTSIILYPDGFLVYGTSTFYGDIIATKNLTVLGTKNRLVKDDIQGNILMNAVESTEPVFEDYGTCELDSKGKCVIRLEKRFLATVNATEQYFVFLSKMGEGDVFVKSKYNFAFVVQGTPGLKVDWRVAAKQKGYENIRMDEFTKGDK